MLLLLLYMLMGMCNLCYAFRNSPQPRCSILELAFSKAEIRSLLKVNGRLSATKNTSLLDLPLVYYYSLRVASHNSICKPIKMKRKPSAELDANVGIFGLKTPLHAYVLGEHTSMKNGL